VVLGQRPKEKESQATWSGEKIMACNLLPNKT
jgi:hypothetical protein